MADFHSAEDDRPIDDREAELDALFNPTNPEETP